jgi:adenylate kinase family enzyme
MRSKLVFVMGATNAGKSTFMTKMGSDYPHVVGLVEVGKLMRAKYPPDHFKGQAAPAHTAMEAWSMMTVAIEQHINNGKRLIFVDGQPRDMLQAAGVLDKYYDDTEHWSSVKFLHLWAHKDRRIERAKKRDAGDEAKLQLSLQRMDNDPPQLYEVLSLVQSRTNPKDFATINTEDPDSVLRASAFASYQGY